MTERYRSPMTKTHTVTIRFTIPDDIDQHEFALSVIEDWYDANDDSFPELVEEVTYEIVTSDEVKV